MRSEVHAAYSDQGTVDQASKLAVFGPPFGGRGFLGGAVGTGAELPTNTSLSPWCVGDAPLFIWPL